MRSIAGRGLAAATVLLWAGAVRAQAPGRVWRSDIGFTASVSRGDHVEFFLTDGVHLATTDLEIRADRAVMVVDHDDLRDALHAGRDDGTDAGLPRRGLLPPDPRRRVSAPVLRARLAAFLSAARTGEDRGTSGNSAVPIHLMRTIYLEGNVLVLQNGRATLRAKAAHFSSVDDRLTLFGAELRLVSEGSQGIRQLVVRGEKLVRQGIRTVGRDLSITTCDAGEPHFEILSGEVEIIQRPDDFEIRPRSSALAFSGTRVLPLPNTRFLLGEQNNLLIQGASLSQGNQQGAEAELELGSSFNDLGGWLHESLTGRPASEFRGDWNLGLGYIQQRGFPIDGGLVYEAPGRYRGRTEGFYLDDRGDDIREIQQRIDGTPIEDNERRFVRTENRVWLSPRTTLDMTVYSATDAAVLPEFRNGLYRTAERPETSLHLRSAEDNRLLTATVRTNANSFSYDDDRSLAPAFREELPLIGLDWFSQPIATIGEDTPVLLSSSTGVGYLRNNADPTGGLRDEDTFRADQELELAVPFRSGPVGIRPFVSARATYYDHTAVAGDQNDTRVAFAAGARAATWLSKVWSWSGEKGESVALRHVMSPAIAWIERFHVDDRPGEFLQFDDVDTLDERTEIRLELLNRFQRRRGSAAPHEFLWVDLAQTITPISDRDNGGHHLGVFEFEVIANPQAEAMPLDHLLFLFEGEHDWNESELRTLNTGVQFGRVLGLDWSAEYRTDRTNSGTIGYGASTNVFNRWQLAGSSVYDLELSEVQSYYTSVQRQDHDWLITFSLSFNVIGNETSFNVDFQPIFGGLFRRPSRFQSRVVDFGLMNPRRP